MRGAPERGALDRRALERGAPGGPNRPAPIGARTSDVRASRGDRASLVARNADLLRRVERLGQVLVELARDLVDARRESAALRRENELLRSRLRALEGSATPAPWSASRQSAGSPHSSPIRPVRRGPGERVVAAGPRR